MTTHRRQPQLAPAEPSPQAPDSLLRALAAVVRAAGRSLDYDDLAGATGVAWLAGWRDGSPCGDDHLAAGRLAAVLSAGPALGLALRDLGIAADAAACSDFPQHFADSFAPLIELALAHDQAVLCHADWPDVRAASEWGILTDIEPDGPRARLVGWSPMGNRVELADPPRQAVVVEAVAPGDPDEADLLSLALAQANRFASPASTPPLRLGSAALAAWARFARQDAPCPRHGGHCRRRMVAHLYARRLAGYEFLCRHGQDAPRAEQTVAMGLEPLLNDQVELLAELLPADPTAPAGRDDFAAALDRLAELQRQIEQCLRPDDSQPGTTP